MMIPGLISVTFRQLAAERIIELVKAAGLNAIEWGGDIHLPHGDLDRAAALRQLMAAAGLKTAAYGSYYKVGRSEQDGLSFETVLDTAVMLNAPQIRVWAGTCEPHQADEAYWTDMADELIRIGTLAAVKDITIVTEFHQGTLTATYEGCRKLMTMVAGHNVFTCWQPIHGLGPEANCDGLRSILQWVRETHVFHWWPDPDTGQIQRFSLARGINDWIKYFEILKNIPVDSYALLEFVKDDSELNFIRDAEDLIALIAS